METMTTAAIHAFGGENLVCDDTEIRGNKTIVSFGNHNIIHPKCRILSPGGGAILFGNHNIVEENVTIINRSEGALQIGDENIFEVGSEVFEGVSMGSGNVIEAKATVKGGTSIGNNCVVGTKCTTWADEDLADNTVIFGLHNDRRTQTPRSKEQISLHLKHVEYLKDVLKRFHAQKAGIVQAIGVVS
ncbi:hypothetical protein HDU84_000882 [Entophlyctis sp. JEL0112]|nr:hypothetical protein HDU84_000882 [Entophlyctis sp. JEL0112]